MNEFNDTTDTSAPAADPLTEQMHSAFQRGDRATAERIMRQRDGNPDSAGEGAPEPVAPEVVEQAHGVLRELPGGEDLAREWGSDLGANLGYARVAVDHLRQHNPRLLEYLESEFTDDDGSTYRPGDDAGMVRLAAQFGRLLAHRDGRAPEPVNLPSRPATRGSQNMDNSGSVEEQIEALTEQMHKEIAKRNHGAAKRLDAQREALIRRQGGDQRIVGTGGRYA